MMQDIGPGDAVTFWTRTAGKPHRVWARIVAIGEDSARVELPDGWFPRVRQIEIKRLTHHREYGVVAVDEN